MACACRRCCCGGLCHSGSCARSGCAACAAGDRKDLPLRIYARELPLGSAVHPVRAVLQEGAEPGVPQVRVPVRQREAQEATRKEEGKVTAGSAWRRRRLERRFGGSCDQRKAGRQAQRLRSCVCRERKTPRGCSPLPGSHPRASTGPPRASQGLRAVPPLVHAPGLRPRALHRASTGPPQVLHLALPFRTTRRTFSRAAATRCADP
jgi:hypothetical protein